MKSTYVLFFSAALLLAGCTKNTTNTTVIAPLPAFTVNGIHDISMRNGGTSFGPASISMPLTIQYTDSAQETVTISLSALPPGITMDTINYWVSSGIPTFSSDLTLYDTTAAGGTPGTYTMTLTATGSVTGMKTYSFILKILPAQSCTQYIAGKYFNCSTSCGGFYTDSVYADPGVVNKIWFTNFNGVGAKIYGIYNCSDEQLTIPSQVAGGITYNGNGDGSGSSSSHYITLNFTEVNGSSGTTSCSISMN